MRAYSSSPVEMVAAVWRHRRLVVTLIRREVAGRYRGSAIGLLWSLLHPVFLLLVYTLVFSVVFKARWSEGTASKSEFALLLFSALILFNVFAECVNRGPTLIVGNVNYVKKVVFPLEVLPWVTLGSALFHAGVSLVVWLVAHVLLLGGPSLTAFYFPAAAIPLALLSLGCTWMLASLGVYLRDVGQVMGVVTTALMFLSPIFYPVSALPEAYRDLMFLNPIAPALEQARAVLFWGKRPDLGVLGVYWAVSLAVAWLGFAWFQKTRRGFADVL